jgi:CBS domain-containing protein
MIARELMRTDVPTLSPDDTIQRAAEYLTHYEHSSLAVIDDTGTLIGTVGEDDMLALALPPTAEHFESLSYLPRCFGLRNLSHEQLQGLKVKDIMRTEEIVTVSADEPAAQVALLIMRHNESQIFVVDGNRYIGRLGRKHIISEIVDPVLGLACEP